MSGLRLEALAIEVETRIQVKCTHCGWQVWLDGIEGRFYVGSQRRCGCSIWVVTGQLLDVGMGHFRFSLEVKRGDL